MAPNQNDNELRTRLKHKAEKLAKSHKEFVDESKVGQDSCNANGRVFQPSIVSDGSRAEILKASKSPCVIYATVKKSTQPKPQPPIKNGLESNRAAVFETSLSRTAKDPTEMTWKERRALFEEKKGEPFMPATLKSSPSPIAPKPASLSASMIDNYNKPVKAKSNASGIGILKTVAALMDAPATISESRIRSETRRIREEEMNVVLNRFGDKFSDDHKSSSSSPTPEPLPPSTPPPVPSILPLQQSSDSCTGSDEYITGATYGGDYGVYHDHYAEISSISSEESEFGKYIDEAINNIDDDLDEIESSVTGGTLVSDSFCYVAPRYKNHLYDTIQYETTIKEEPTTSSSNDSTLENVLKSKLTLNSLSSSSENNSSSPTENLYPHYQMKVTASVHKTIDPMYAYISTDDTDHYEDEKISREYIRTQQSLVENKIKLLNNSIDIQNQQIVQSSNALNTCSAMPEFAGSSESVVAEWKLLVATHSRKALLDEVYRLEKQKVLRAPNATKECCRLTIKNIVLPLREDYVKKMAEEKIVGHHLVCLLKYNEHVIATKTIPTLPGLKAVKFPGELHLNNVYADFKITLEIYGIIAQKESIPHEIKYHISKARKSLIGTPKRKKSVPSLVMPPIKSPFKRDAIHTPAFAFYGFTTFDLREVQRNTWKLQKSSPEISPLNGIVQMKINCALTMNIDHRAFLTMFDEVNKFGAWHRRWYRLHGNMLSYWKYPDDENIKPPIASIDLSACEQHRITLAPRQMCTRSNTFMIELKRPRHPDDRNSWLHRIDGEYTYDTYLLSADDKKERDAWCEYFNKTFLLMRASGTSNRKPTE